MGAWGDRETRIFLKAPAWGITLFFQDVTTGRPKFPGKPQILPPKRRETRIFLHFPGFFRPKFPGISWRVTPKFRENSKFWQKFPGKNLHFSSRIPGNPYILAFSGVLTTKIPGNSWKGRPRIFVKIRNFDKNFPGKFWIGPHEFRETRIFLHFYDSCWPKFLGIFVETSPIFEKFCKSFPGKNLIFTPRISGNP